ncbi:hypothetical protein BGX31_001614, partial [Mortierella sp. GBA43]
MDFQQQGQEGQQQQQQQQQQPLEPQLQPQQQQQQEPSAVSSSSTMSTTTANHPAGDRANNDNDEHAETMLSEHQRALVQHQENQRQQEIYLQQLQLMQRLQAMPGSTSRPWYPTFGPILATSCSDNTIQLDNPNQYTLINNAKLNRHAVGPHWRSIQTSVSFSPTPSPPSSSPQMQARSLIQSSLSSSLSMASTTTSLHAYLSATYSSAASIDQVRASSFHQHDDQDMEAISESTGVQQRDAVHQEFYQKHSYPHDPRHHLLHGLPENSREARENHPTINRSPAHTPFPVGGFKARSNAKRKWDDDDDDDDDDDGEQDNDQGVRLSQDESIHHHHQVHHQHTNTTTIPYPTPTSTSSPSQQQGAGMGAGVQPHPHPPTSSFSNHSSVQQFVPTTAAAAAVTTIPRIRSGDQDQEDHDMGSTDPQYPNRRLSNRVRMDDALMDQEDMDMAEGGATTAAAAAVVAAYNSNGSANKPRRSKPRLDHSAIGITMAEARRLQSGEQVQDILQECFYNAAASSSR